MGADPPRLAGRERELAALSHELDAVLRREARTVVLRGEPGIGKTALMSAACRAVEGRAIILSARNLPLTTRVPNLAVRSLLAQAEGVPDDAAVRSPVPVRLDTAVQRLLDERPVVIAMDDLQWADSSTLDALMFLAGGAEDRPLGVIATVRSGNAREVDRWCADLLRLPGTRSLEVGALDRLGVRDLLAGLLDETPHETLVTDVLSRTGGNPYHARLLVEGLDPAALAAPTTAADLDSALLQSWSQMPERTRELTVMLAIHGKPVRPAGLAEIHAAWRDTWRDLRPAIAVRVLDQDSEGRVWFHHPLIAELLVASVPEVERRERHAVLARSTALAIESGLDGADVLVDLADHLAAAGDAAACIVASRRAIEALEGVDDATRLRLARRNAELAGAAPDVDRMDELAVLAAWADAAAAVAEDEDEYAAVSALLDRVDRDADPVATAELLLRRQRLQFRIGGELNTVANAKEILEYASSDVNGRQYALALGDLAHAENLEGDPACIAHAAQALELARRIDDGEALAYALAAAGQVAATTRDLAAATRLAEETFAVAIPGRHFWPAALASFWVAYSMPGYRQAATRLRELREILVEAGAPHRVTTAMAVTEAASWLTIGEVGGVGSALRFVRTEHPPDFVDLSLRGVAARLAAYQGRVEEAEAELQRARERFPTVPSYVVPARAVAEGATMIAAGEPEAALAVLGPAIEAYTGTHATEWLVPLAARAHADLIDAARDRRESPGRALDDLEAFREAHPRVLPRRMGTSYPRDLVALDALYDAEVARSRDDDEAFERWSAAADACAAAELAWEEAYACRRGAERGLVRDHGSRSKAVALLRRGAAIAERTQSEGLAAELESLAAWSRVRLHPDGAVDDDEVSDFPLTRRERELLPYIVDGRTYAEIAALLTISEKTVSSHISNLLRKTGAANRVDLARMVQRRERSA
ncbi:helix-turn-helix transcriptional regulator [Agromyces sp. M3QZ16-3]|uniref:helix-turn-helix transcriptional regulator n=1 Tax=Agromyces sp. M3QZ16-3 TaxID=3447585 RepID=UPI003F68D122